MQAMIADVEQRAGIPDLSPHILRHTAVQIWQKWVKDDRVGPPRWATVSPQ